jgi:3-hydroxyacyl-CoA dehydrogenase / 3-hydroxy-2-methylbutyryl-CoA dehydrogenase
MGIFKSMVDMHLTGPFNVSRLSAAAFSQNLPDGDGQRGVIVNTWVLDPKQYSRAAFHLP